MLYILEDSDHVTIGSPFSISRFFGSWSAHAVWSRKARVHEEELFWGVYFPCGCTRMGDFGGDEMISLRKKTFNASMSFTFKEMHDLDTTFSGELESSANC